MNTQEYEIKRTRVRLESMELGRVELVRKTACRVVTNARFARLHSLQAGPVPFSTSPDPPHKSRARH